MSINAQLTCNRPKPPLTLAELAPLLEEDAGAELEGRIVFDVGAEVGPVVADPEPDAPDPDAALPDAEDFEEPLEADEALDADDLDEPELDADDADEPEDEPEDVDEADDPEDCEEPLKY